MTIKNKYANFSQYIDSDDNDEIDQKFNQILEQLTLHPELETINLGGNDLEDRHLRLLFNALKIHKDLISLNIGYNFTRQPHPNLIPLLLKFINENNSKNIKIISLISCNLNDKDFIDLFNGLTKEQRKILFFRLQQNGNLTSFSVKYALTHVLNQGTLSGLSQNLSIYEEDPSIEPKFDRLFKEGYPKQILRTQQTSPKNP